MTEHLNPNVQAVLDRPVVRQALDVIRQECDQAGLSWTDVLMLAIGQELPAPDTDQTVRPLSGLPADQDADVQGDNLLSEMNQKLDKIISKLNQEFSPASASISRLR